MLLIGAGQLTEYLATMALFSGFAEDLWAPSPPSSAQAVAGATVLLNLSASNETIGNWPADLKRHRHNHTKRPILFAIVSYQDRDGRLKPFNRFGQILPLPSTQNPENDPAE